MTDLVPAVGINLSGLEYGWDRYPGVLGQDYFPPTADDIAFFASKGLRLFRIPFLWERMQPTLGADLDPAHLEIIRYLCSVIATEAHGEAVIVPTSDGSSFSAPNWRGTVVGTPEVPIEAFADFWRRMAAALKGQPGLWGFDLFNEPQGFLEAFGWPRQAQAAVTAIREVDADIAIVLEGSDWARNFDALLGAVTDPAGKLVYSLHCYPGNAKDDYRGATASDAVAGQGVQQIQAFIDWLGGRAGYIGEIGLAGGPNYLAELEACLALAKRHGLPVTAWNGGSHIDPADPLNLSAPIGAERLAVLARTAT